MKVRVCCCGCGAAAATTGGRVSQPPSSSADVAMANNALSMSLLPQTNCLGPTTQGGPSGSRDVGYQPSDGDAGQQHGHAELLATAQGVGTATFASRSFCCSTGMADAVLPSWH